MRTSSVILLVSLFFACSSSTDNATAQAQQKISQFEKAGLCDLLIDKSGVYHAVFQESPDFGKPVFIYYSSSTNKGASWSKPIAISNDQTGNGAGYPRILQDAGGRIYAIWKRYGESKGQYPVREPNLDGPGGIDKGTLFYKVLSGGAWSNQVQLNESELGQVSWFATLTPTGAVEIFWTQGSFESIKNSRVSESYADYMRTVTLNGTSFSAYIDLTVPAKPEYAGGFPAEKNGKWNLNGYVDKKGAAHLIYVDAPAAIEQIKYFDGKAQRIVYSYPKYQAGNTFHNPPKLLFDENGNDHLVFVPSASTLESEQIWDINLTTNKTNVLTAIQVPGVSITGFQATQGPNGNMAVTFEVYTKASNQEAYGMFYNQGVWKNVGLTNNAAKEKFFTKDFIGVYGLRNNISTLTSYNSTFGSVAYDAAGKKSMLMTIALHHVMTGGYSTNNPSIVFVPID